MGKENGVCLVVTGTNVRDRHGRVPSHPLCSRTHSGQTVWAVSVVRTAIGEKGDRCTVSLFLTSPGPDTTPVALVLEEETLSLTLLLCRESSQV